MPMAGQSSDDLLALFDSAPLNRRYWVSFAILCGVGGWPGVIANAQIDPRVRNGALGFTGAMQDLPAHTAAGGTLMVFSVPVSQRSTASAQPAPQAAEGAGSTAPPKPASPHR